MSNSQILNLQAQAHYYAENVLYLFSQWLPARNLIVQDLILYRWRLYLDFFRGESNGIILS